MIDSLRDTNGSLDRDAVSQILPYGDAFMFVDSVTQLTEDTVNALYRVPTSGPFIDAHFSHVSVMPGVLLGEALAQAGIVLLHYHLAFNQDVDIVVNAVNKARFKSPALPDDLLEEHVEIKALNKIGARLSGHTLVRDQEVCRAMFDVTFVPREKLLQLTHEAKIAN
jgi:3-hydroxymyristoyl/3-hydroxydecanoyl-(acyl carrier protein) dehydratase